MIEDFMIVSDAHIRIAYNCGTGEVKVVVMNLRIDGDRILNSETKYQCS